MPSVSERTIYRRMERYRLRALNFSNISDDELDPHVMEVAEDFPFCREQMFKFRHKERGIKGVSRKLRPARKLTSQTSEPETSDPSNFFKKKIYIANSSQFLSPDALWSRNVHSQQPQRIEVYHCCNHQTVSEKLTSRFKIAANTLMTFAGEFFTEEIERQSHYNVQIEVSLVSTR